MACCVPFANSAGTVLFPVSQISVISQARAYGYETGISYTEVVKAGTPPADITCPAISSALRTRFGQWLVPQG